ncbi:aminotransferase class III-fold pyridoxal phosphate-dependent enzyme [Mycobacterium sp. OTB74]|jgi:4-aminobutyrate aminotransferase-like enzyme|uniref:aminotransferase class III-fold pyridoxal phosphate-dependent enzyme n=1 Tax=Mycobacterium sp. OTB74 TaxID=1853452 RepID=UPI0024770027|nr:aminotransferase class III-fold pyridoxal phosphate-dependent enzyme [Mycobacterium sp. OTB74]MDH6244121.1 4-aminobutyrate aminotransferase-like enzyme [Mycobacterium sp. OTB74]
MTITNDVLPEGLTLDSLRADAQRASDLDRAHVFHSWSAQAQLNPMTITAAEGRYVWDDEGNRLLDFSSQLVNTNIGHQHPKVLAAIQEQAATLCTIAPQHVNAARSEAARLLAELTPGDVNTIFFTNGGADAVELAVRMARLHTGKYKVLSRYRAYHGGLTYSGHPLACAAAVATINVMREEGMVENAARIGEQVIGPALCDFAQRHRSVGEVRGAAVFWAIELVADRATREPLAPYGRSSAAMNAVIASCKQLGLLPFTNFNRIHVAPPCNASSEEAREGLAILDRVLEVADRHAN